MPEKANADFSLLLSVHFVPNGQKKIDYICSKAS